MPWLFLAAAVVLLFTVLTLVGRIEKRMVWPYGPPEPAPQVNDVRGYREKWVNDAARADFEFHGWCSDLKGKHYPITYGMLTSPERDCLAIIGAGTLMGIPLKGTWIYSRSADARMFYTTDNQAAVEVDIARQWQCQLAPVRSFERLLQRHRDCLRERGFPVKPFSAGRELDEFKRLREEHFQMMARDGAIAFVDESCTLFRYTWWGAFRLMTRNYMIGLVRAVTLGRVPRVA